MISRRHFLKTGSIVTATAFAATDSLGDTGSHCETVPAPIAALKSMKSLATPITIEERRERWEKARILMQANHLDAILLMQGTSLNYFTGIQWWGGERLFALVMPAKGAAFYVCPAFERDRAQEQIANSPEAAQATVRTWQEDENPYDLVAHGLKSLGIATGRLGIEESIRFAFSDGVAKSCPSLTIASATPVTAGCRMFKSKHELALMRLANQATLTAYSAAYRSLKEGMTQHELQTLIADAYKRLGFEGEASVQVGEFSALPHGSTSPQVIREGAIIMVDDGCTIEGYNSDITRTFVLGKASDKMKRVFENVRHAQDEALRAARPGVECREVDAAARKVITAAGYGPDYKYFPHRVGHGIGMDGHEWPYLVRGNTTKLEPGMTFSDEPGIYIRGEFGIRLEDDMHITENGAELFTSQSPSLEDPFGSA